MGSEICFPCFIPLGTFWKSHAPKSTKRSQLHAPCYCRATTDILIFMVNHVMHLVDVVALCSFICKKKIVCFWASAF